MKLLQTFQRGLTKCTVTIPAETSAKLTYANAFDHEFSLLLRERRPISLLNMQDATLEVESNILASNRLKKEIA